MINYHLEYFQQCQLQDPELYKKKKKDIKKKEGDERIEQQK